MFTDNPNKTPDRRIFLVAGLTAAAGLAAWRFSTNTEVVADETLPAPHSVTIVDFSPDGRRGETVTVPAIIKTDAAWRQQLPSRSFPITRHADTEIPWTGPYWNNHAHGLYRCICCDTALFSSDTKFDSGTGWPSFYQPIAKENVTETTDNSLGAERTAVSCTRCDSHLGHVFNDGPDPTGLRYCMNSVSLNFVRTT